MMLAKKYDLTPIGTMAHEFLMAGQAFVRISESQKYMLEAWVKEYRGDLGIALTDTIGIDAFLRDFDSYFAKLYDGVRQDSGDPFDFGEKVIKHYQKMRIDPRTKRAVFTDGLDIPTALSLHEKFGSRIDTSFGIGTNLTNDLGPAPINIVVKMVECNGQPVAKISDSPGKQMCEDEEYVNYLKKVFGIEK
jgi:nicotinate phosphoribosyltransferase